MRTCASCGRKLGAAFAVAPNCPCCGGSIRGDGPAVQQPAETFPEFADTMRLIVTRAAAAASQPPAATDGAAEIGVTAYFSSVELPAAAPPESAALPPRPTTDDKLAATVLPREEPTHELHTQTFVAPLHAPAPASSDPPPTKPPAGDLPPVQPPDTPAPFDPTRLTGIWSGTVGGSGHERMTIRTAGAVEEIPSLVVNPRAVEHRGGIGADDADYQLFDVIGEGGIGVVYAARQASIDRTVAVKMLQADKAADERQRGKFLSEAVVTGELDHPNIVPIYDLGANRQGALFYSMKRVRGTPWNKVLKEKSPAENLEILMKVADAVAFAHSRQVVHRDLKPENVMLGDFGEVLLMDWGLALLLADARRRVAALHDPGMGGTPAYMAPEMASGPIETIDARSDVYLLGAILFETATGKPPHSGGTVMGCLFAAAQNEIVAVDRHDELIDIARRAMATRREDRYQSVKDFQTAIRDYQSHSESIALVVCARADLDVANETGDYGKFSEALFGYRQALEMWDGNREARDGLRVTQLSYAEAAVDKGDVDLALSMLDPHEPSQAPLHAHALSVRQEREQKQQRLHAAKRMALALALLVVAVGIGAFVQIRRDRDRAVGAETSAVAAERDAQSSAKLAQEEAARALLAEKAAKDAEQLAKDEFDRAKIAEKKATDAAAAAQQAETDARKAKDAESYEAYVARIGLAAAKIEENSFGTAIDLLNNCEAGMRRWEWARLMYLCEQNAGEFNAVGPVDAVAYSPDGKRVLAGSWDNRARIWSLDKSSTPITFLYGGQYVHAAAFSPDGETVALGGSDPRAYAQIRDADTGRIVKIFVGHEDGVLGVAFSRDGGRLLTCSYDRTARLWDIATGKELQRFEGHNWWVWSATFAPPAEGAAETRIVTAGQDGTVLVWDIATGRASPPFTGHNGPVHAAAFSPDGKQVVSAGADRRLLIWDPTTLKPIDFEKLIDDKPRPPPPFAALEGHTAAVRSVAFSRDGRHLVSGGHDNTVKVWDLASKSLVKTLRGHAGWVRSCMFSPDGSHVVSGSHDGRILLWDLGRYQEQRVLAERVLQGHSDAVLYAAFSPDDSQIVTAGRDHTAVLWNATTGKSAGQLLEGHAFLASQAEFYPASAAREDLYVAGRIVTAGVDNTARVWDVALGVQILRLEPAGRAAAVAVSHDGRWILTGSDRESALLWDAANGKQVLELATQGDEVVWVAFSPDDATLFTGEAGGYCRLWNRADGKLLRSLAFHNDRITGAAFTPDGLRLLTASADHAVAQWDVAAGRALGNLMLKHPAPVSSLALAPDGGFALTGCGDGKVRVWNLASAAVERVLFDGDSALHVSLSHNGRLALTTDSGRRFVRLWEVATGRELPPPQRRTDEVAPAGAPFLDASARGELVWCAMFSPADDRLLTVGGNGAKLWELGSGNELQQFSPHGAIAAAEFSPDGRRVVTGSWDRSARVWDVATARALVKLAGVHTANINHVCFSPDGRNVLTASDDGTARLFDAETGQPREPTFKHDGPVYDARFSRDGLRIVTAGNDKLAKIWDARSGKLLKELSGHAWGVQSCSFSYAGTRVVTASADNNAAVWDAETGKQLTLLKGHTAGVTSAAFSRDGERVLTGAQDNLAKLWDARNGKEILTLKGHSEEVSSVTFSHDGTRALTTGRDGTAIVWPGIDKDWGNTEEKTPH